ncbi:hypothetical protein ACP3P6_07095 [Enterobacter mori]
MSNASPYYVTLVNLKLGGQTLENLMVAPKTRTAGAANRSQRHALLAERQ